MVGNTLQKEPKKNGQMVEIKANGETFNLTLDTVRNYLVSGNKESVTNQEIAMFMNLCRFSHLNPWVGEAYCIKYGSDPATMVVGKEAFQKRAESNQNYDGAEAGIIVHNKETGEVIYRIGTMKLPGEDIVGGYAEVWRKDREHSTRIEVSFDEYAARKKDGTLNSQWTKKPATMIRKVALVQALRESFPSALGGLFTAEEQGVEEPAEMPVEIPSEVKNDEAKQAESKKPEPKSDIPSSPEEAEELFNH